MRLDECFRRGLLKRTAPDPENARRSLELSIARAQAFSPDCHTLGASPIQLQNPFSPVNLSIVTISAKMSIAAK